MTRDLAVLAEESNMMDRTKYLSTFEFIDKIAEDLNEKLIDGEAAGKPEANDDVRMSAFMAFIS